MIVLTACLHGKTAEIRTDISISKWTQITFNVIKLNVKFDISEELPPCCSGKEFTIFNNPLLHKNACHIRPLELLKVFAP